MEEKVESNALSEIFDALRLDETESAIVENILREDVFHSTLDWQTREQLLGGAIRAHDLFRQDEAFHRAAFHHHKAHYQLVSLEAHLGPDSKDPALTAARADEAAARESLNAHLSNSATECA